MSGKTGCGWVGARWASAVVAAAIALGSGGTGLAAASTGPVGGAASSHGGLLSQPADIVSAPTRVAHTRLGDVGYREIGEGSPIVLITGYGASMDSWAPSFIDALATRHRVVVFDNAGVGATAALAQPGISAMAQQTSALISTLCLGRTAVLGWSMGGMVAQALAVLHPEQVSWLILAATQAGDGRSAPVPPDAAAKLDSPNPAVVLSVLFPADQLAAAQAYAQGVLEYPGFYQASSATRILQNQAIAQWMAGDDPVGRRLDRIRVPVLVADGTQDELDPVSNAFLLAASVQRVALRLYPDAGHAFLFQDAASFVPVVDAFLR